MMKMKRALLALLMTCVLTATLIIGLSAEVRAENSKYFGLYNHSNYRPTNVLITTYCMNVPGSTNSNKPVVKIYEYNGSAKSSTVVDRNAQIYCLRAGLGFGAGEVNPDANTIREYTYSHDLKDKAGMATTYQNTLPSGDYYNEMVWVLDNLINPRDGNTADDEDVLSKAGTSLNAFRNPPRAGQMSDEQYANIIEAIQQCVIWYFTNRDASSEFTQQATTKTTMTGNDSIIQTLIGGIHYTSAGNTYGSGTALPQLYIAAGDAANTPVGKLALYYLTKAEENKATALSSTGTNTASFDKSRATMTKSGDYYYVGPYKYTGVNASSVTITTPDSAPHTLVKAPNASGAELSGSSDLAKVNGNKNTDFYIKVPIKYNNKTVTGNVTISVEASYTAKTLTYWNVEGAVNNNQPLAVIENTNKTLNENDSKEVSNPEMDLALRKYITRIESATGEVKFNSDDRVPTVDEPPKFTLDNGTTAKKQHPKNAMLVEKGDIVTYTITIYNEGDIDGTNIQVEDYLPSGLTYKSGDWTANGTKNGYTVYKSDYGTLEKYDGLGKLTSKSKTIKCEVTKNPGTSAEYLKNIAQITSYSGGTDRDSNSLVTPSANYSNDGVGKGVEDDDDFEHLYLAPKQEFDLALRKYITKIVSADGKIKFNSTNRVPNMNPLTFNLDNGTTAQKKHPKNALRVEEGDLVTYTITVYNEGDVAASNVQVTDYLPAGLTNQSSTWTSSGTKNGFSAYTLNFGNILGFNGTDTTLPSVSREITCKVTATTGSDRQDLKNIAEISNYAGGTDRDSHNPVNPRADYSNDGMGKGDEDDDDFEYLYLAPSTEFDLALRKYITKIESADGTVKFDGDRSPKMDPLTFNLDDGTTATKRHTKDPLKVAEGDIVTYTITIYNEAKLAASNVQVTDYLPSGLTNQSNDWTQGENKNGYAAYTSNFGDIPAYNGTDSTLPSKSKTIKCKVTASAGNETVNLKNIAEITSANGGEDRDSHNPVNPRDDYKPSTATQGKGEEDDDDYEHLYLEPKAFDLALRKYITEIKDKDGKTKYSQEQVANRKPEIANPPKFNLDENKTAEKTHEKDALKVEKGDLVTYTIVVYNEGELDGSNIVVKDYLPAGLSYKSGDWTADGTNNGYTTYKSNYGEVSKYDGKGILPSKSKTITCEVTSDVGNETIDLKNIAEITEATGGTDRDSNPGTITPSKEYNPENSEKGKGIQDDDDFEHLYLEPNRIVDLALRKHIIKVTNSDGSTVKYSEEQLQNRNPDIATPPVFNLDNGTTAEKKHTKAALTVKTGDLVTYRINVYNEGNVAANNVVVTDYIPAGLKVVSEGWNKGETDSKGYTAYTKTYSNIPAASANKLGEVSEDIVCQVVATSGKTNINLKNIAEITTFEGDDRDSNPGSLTPSDDYNPEDSEKGKGIQDDDDFENVVLEPNTFDLALKKFIAAVNGEELKTNGVYDRAPTVDTSKRDGDKVTSFTYTFSANKEPIKVENNDVITYVIRVYNEGGKAGYAKQIKDDIPVGLVFIPDNEINTKNGWYMVDSSGKKTTDASKAASVVTDDFGYGKDKAKLLKAFDSATMANNPDYLDVEIAFRVGQPAKDNKERIVINSAQVSENSDENGDDVDDIDSDEDNMTPGKPSEDDEDIEKIYVKYFDLSLRKWTTQAIVIEDGKQTTKNTGHKPEDNPEALVKVEVNKKRIESTVIKFKYTIRVTNEGEIAGAATEISEYVPDGLKFVQSDNPDWKETNGKVTTTKLKDKILKPGEHADIDITLTWINSANNVKAMNNIAEISDDYNESGTPDRDSIPNNKKDGEDDIDDAPVIVTMVTGSKPTYFLLAGSVLAIIVSGATLLKKYVLS